MCAKKSDHVPGNPIADYLMQHRFLHQTNSGAGDNSNEIITGMKRPLIPDGSEKVGAWEIHAVTIRPCISQESEAWSPKPYAANSCYAHFQLLYGQYTDILSEEDAKYDDLITAGTFHLDLATQGANSHFWPMALDVVNPRPVFAEYLSFVSETPNVAPVNTLKLTVSIWYAPIILHARQVELMLAMRARL